jgi:hypothetical protein
MAITDNRCGTQFTETFTHFKQPHKMVWNGNISTRCKLMTFIGHVSVTSKFARNNANWKM